MDNNNTNITLKPTKALIIYEGKKTYNQEYYIESREIKSVGGKYHMTSPIPLSENTLKDIAKSYMQKNSAEIHHGFISEHILYGKSDPGKLVMIWYRPSAKRVLNFSAGLKIKGKSEVTVPATIYVLLNSKLYIYALGSDKRPDAETKIFNAPYFNIYEDGNVCLGSAQIGKHKADTYEGEAERFERAFYLAEQNHGQNKDQSKTDPEKLWTSLIKNKKPFPITELIPHKKYKTVKHLLENLIHEEEN